MTPRGLSWHTGASAPAPVALQRATHAWVCWPGGTEVQSHGLWWTPRSALCSGAAGERDPLRPGTLALDPDRTSILSPSCTPLPCCFLLQGRPLRPRGEGVTAVAGAQLAPRPGPCGGLPARVFLVPSSAIFALTSFSLLDRQTSLLPSSKTSPATVLWIPRGYLCVWSCVPNKGAHRA